MSRVDRWCDPVITPMSKPTRQERSELPAGSIESKWLASEQGSTVTNLALSFNDTANREVLLPRAVEHVFCFLEFLGGNHQQHAYSHIEGAHHLFLSHVSYFLQVAEDGEHRPRDVFDHRGAAPRQNARQVIGDPSSGDVGHGRDAFGRY